MKRFLVAVTAFVVCMSLGFSQSSVQERYFAAVKLYDMGQYTKARVAWFQLLADERPRLKPKQIRVLEQRIKLVDELIEKTQYRLPGQTNTDMARDALTRGFAYKSKDSNDIRARQEFDKAIMYLERAAEAQEEDIHQPYIMAYCLLYTERLEPALVFARQAMQKTPEDTRAVNLAAEICRKAKQINGYISYLTKSLALDEKQIEVHYRLAKSLIARDKPGDMARAFTHAKASVAGTNIERAREFSRLFPLRSYQDQMEALASDIAIRQQLGNRPSVWQRR